MQSVEMATLQKRTLLAMSLDEIPSSSESEGDKLFFTIVAITGDCCGGEEHPKS